MHGTSLSHLSLSRCAEVQEIMAVSRLLFHVTLFFSLLLLVTGVPLITGGDDSGGETTTASFSSSSNSQPTSQSVEAVDMTYESDDYDYDAVAEDTPSPVHPPISDHLPRFIISLPDHNLLCFSIDGFELFTYNLLSTPNLHINSFLNITKTPDGEWVRGGTDLGFLMKIKDERVKNGQRLFKIKVYGAEKKADIAGFGQVDMQGGEVEFSVDKDGHSNIESSEATQEQITIAMESPKVRVRGVSGDRVTYNVYIEDSSGLMDIPTHGILGQFLRPSVRLDTDSGELHLGDERDPIPVQPDKVWDSVLDEDYQKKQCWYPVDRGSPDLLEGQPYDYVTEHLLAHKYIYSQFNPKSQL